MIKKVRKICQSLFTETKMTWIEEKDNFPTNLFILFTILCKINI